MNLKRIHHIEFVVHDLERAAAQYETIFNLAPPKRERSEDRGVETAHFVLGETRVILVQPIADHGFAKRFLDTRGEGFFHVAYEVSDLEAMLLHLKKHGIRLMNTTARRGLEGWKVINIEPEETCSVLTQIVELA